MAARVRRGLREPALDRPLARRLRDGAPRPGRPRRRPPTAWRRAPRGGAASRRTSPRPGRAAAPPTGTSIDCAIASLKGSSTSDGSAVAAAGRLGRAADGEALRGQLAVHQPRRSRPSRARRRPGGWRCRRPTRRRRAAIGRLRVAVAASGAQMPAMPKPSTAIGTRDLPHRGVDPDHPAQPEERAGRDREPDAGEDPRVHLVGEPAHDRRHHDRDDGHRHHQQRRAGRRVAEHELGPEHQREAHARWRRTTSSRWPAWRSRSCGRGRGRAASAARCG